jgi:hypothetical protein
MNGTERTRTGNRRGVVMARAAAVAMALLSLAACGPKVHKLDDAADPLSGSALSQGVLSTTLRGFDGDKPFSSMIAGDRSTIFMVTGEPCDGCEDAVRTLMSSAFTEPAYSVIVLGFPVVPKGPADASVNVGATIFGVPDAEAMRTELDISSYPTFVVVTPEAEVSATFTGSSAAQQAIEAARGG